MPLRIDFRDRRNLTLGVGFVIILAAFFVWPSNNSNRQSQLSLPSSPANSNYTLSISRPAQALIARTNAEAPAIKLPAIQSKPGPPALFTVRTPEQIPRKFAPFGRLLRCQLVNTIDSVNVETPIIALLTDDLYHGGDLIIPAGTELHGQAKIERVRERLGSAGPWTVVWKNGQTLVLSGVALDREFEVVSETYGITDGSYGLKGSLLKSDSLAELKLFAATALSAVAEGLSETRQTPFGSFLPRTAKNAGTSAGQAVIDRYAEQVLEAIRRDGLFCRVPAGKEFYVYVTQAIDLSLMQGPLSTTNTPSPPTQFSIR